MHPHSHPYWCGLRLKGVVLALFLDRVFDKDGQPLRDKSIIDVYVFLCRGVTQAGRDEVVLEKEGNEKMHAVGYTYAYYMKSRYSLHHSRY